MIAEVLGRLGRGPCASLSRSAQHVTLRVMAQWTIVGGPREYEPSGGTDAERGWAWDLERYGVQSTVRVELARTAAVVLAAGGPIANEAERAVQTRGKSAVELWWTRRRFPNGSWSTRRA